jgi:hypothetical protein
LQVQPEDAVHRTTFSEPLAATLGFAQGGYDRTPIDTKEGWHAPGVLLDDDAQAPGVLLGDDPLPLFEDDLFENDPTDDLSLSMGDNDTLFPNLDADLDADLEELEACNQTGDAGVSITSIPVPPTVLVSLPLQLQIAQVAGVDCTALVKAATSVRKIVAAHVLQLQKQQSATAPCFAVDSHGNQVRLSAAPSAGGAGGAGGAHALQSQYACLECGNTDQSKFVDEMSGGDVVCMECGIVFAQRKAHEGQAYRYRYWYWLPHHLLHLLLLHLLLLPLTLSSMYSSQPSSTTIDPTVVLCCVVCTYLYLGISPRKKTAITMVLPPTRCYQAARIWTQRHQVGAVCVCVCVCVCVFVFV